MPAAAGWSLRDRRTARARRHGRGPPRARHPARPHGRGQDAAAGPRPRPVLPGPLPPRGALRGVAEPPVGRRRSTTPARTSSPATRCRTSSWSTSRARRCATCSASGNKLVPERALEIVDGVLAALAYSHQQGIVHRDIKPANVMLTRAGDVKVMDFGIARAMADIGATMTQTSAVIGTAQYLSPEQARGEQVDARSDLYSTGCLLYELLTGRPPFVGDSPVSVAYQHVREEPVPPSQLDPDVPPQRRRDRAQGAGQGPRTTATRPPTRCGATSPRRWPAGRSRPWFRRRCAQQTQAMIPHHRAAGDHDDARRSTVDGGPRSPSGTAGAGGRSATRCSALAVRRRLRHRGTASRARLLGGRAPRQVAVPDVRRAHASRTPGPPSRRRGSTLGDQTEKPTATTSPRATSSTRAPRAGTRIDEGRAVSVVGLDRARRRPTVPTLVGLSLDEARQALHDAGLELGRHDPEPSDQDRNTVLRVEPERGRDGARPAAGRRHLRQRQQQGARRGPARPRPTARNAASSRPASPVPEPHARRSRPTPSRAPCCAADPRPARPSG